MAHPAITLSGVAGKLAGVHPCFLLRSARAHVVFPLLLSHGIFTSPLIDFYFVVFILMPFMRSACTSC